MVRRFCWWIAGLSACGGSAEVQAPQRPVASAAGETSRPTLLRVTSAASEGEFPVPDDPTARLALHAVDGSLADAWTVSAAGRFEFRPGVLSTIDLVPGDASSASAWADARRVTRLRWRAWPVGAISPGPWQEEEIAPSEVLTDNPWVRLRSGSTDPVQAVDLEVLDATAGSGEVRISEIRFEGRPEAPDEAQRSTRWQATVGLVPGGPLPSAEDWPAWWPQAIDPARCAVWLDGVEHRGTKRCEQSKESLTVGVILPDGEERVFSLQFRAVGGCFALLDGMPYTRCAPPEG